MIVSTEKLGAIRRDNEEKVIALRFGCYDLLHAGHQEGIDFVSSMADVVVVGVMSDEYVRSQKGSCRPINNIGKRIAAIDQAEGVDYSFVAPSKLFALSRAILRLNPDLYVQENVHSSRIKNGVLQILGIKPIEDTQNKRCSSTQMIAELGIDLASASSSLQYAKAQ